MKRKLLLTIISSLTLSLASAQIFYVEPTEKGFEKEITSRLDFNGLKLSNEKNESDYIITYHYQKNSKNLKFEGYIKLTSTDQNQEIYRTEIIKKPANAFNGYQAMPQIIKTATEKYLLPELKRLMDKN